MSPFGGGRGRTTEISVFMSPFILLYSALGVPCSVLNSPWSSPYPPDKNRDRHSKGGHLTTIAFSISFNPLSPFLVIEEYSM